MTLPDSERPALARWVTWLGHEPCEPLPPLRRLHIGENLAGHLRWRMVGWLVEHGIMPLSTPLGGSGLHMAESRPRLIVTRAVAGQHPQTADAVIAWFEDPVAGWHAAPTPGVWHAKRHARRLHARQRRLGGSAAALADHQVFAA